jgi:hypothetical protein
MSLADHAAVTLDEALEQLCSDRVYAEKPGRLYPQLRHSVGDWGAHVRSWRTAPLRTLTVRYEDMLSAPVATFTTVVQFVGLPFDAARLDKAIRFSAFDVLRQQETDDHFRERSLHSPSGRFFRRGRAGGWRDTLTPAQIDRVWSAHERTMRDLGYGADE